jgi:hypothetical protein
MIFTVYSQKIYVETCLSSFGFAVWSRAAVTLRQGKFITGIRTNYNLNYFLIHLLIYPYRLLRPDLGNSGKGRFKAPPSTL